MRGWLGGRVGEHDGWFRAPAPPPLPSCLCPGLMGFRRSVALVVRVSSALLSRPYRATAANVCPPFHACDFLSCPALGPPPTQGAGNLPDQPPQYPGPTVLSSAIMPPPLPSRPPVDPCRPARLPASGCCTCPTAASWRRSTWGPWRSG